MKRAIKLCLRIAAAVIVALLTLLIIAGSVFAFKGYRMYRDATSETPLNELVESIRAREDFVSYDELPQIYIDAVISSEDKRFFSHCGVDLLAICRAVFNDLRTLSFAEGGSTISQQLMKNEYFTQEKTFERKFAEVFAALALERELGKEEIFELYVNTIYFGSGYYGITDAARGYYGKNPSELSDFEAVMLAGLPNAPSVYSPDVNPALASERMRQVLRQMVDCGVITEEDAVRICSGGQVQPPYTVEAAP